VLSLILPVSSALLSLSGVFGTPIAFLRGGQYFSGERNWQGTSVHVAAKPDQKTGRRQECNHETSIHSRLLSRSARPASVDNISIRSIRAVAG